MLDSKANTEKRKAGGRCMLSRLEKMREGCVKNAKVQDVITLVLSPLPVKRHGLQAVHNRFAMKRKALLRCHCRELKSETRFV